jgi:hypothetical protein
VVGTKGQDSRPGGQNGRRRSWRPSEFVSTTEVIWEGYWYDGENVVFSADNTSCRGLSIESARLMDCTAIETDVRQRCHGYQWSSLAQGSQTKDDSPPSIWTAPLAWPSSCRALRRGSIILFNTIFCNLQRDRRDRGRKTA